MKKSKAHDKAVKDAYNLLVNYRNRLEEEGKAEAAERVENAYKMLWVQCLNEKAPWHGEPACDNPGFGEVEIYEKE